jgi:ectoine hydroxylase-related dioxygenase (phytanoyl-CoA dioxygenase family)
MATAEPTMGLTRSQIAEFQENGFLIFESLLTSDELEAMRRRADEIARGELPEGSRIMRRVEPAVERGEVMAMSYEDSLRKMHSLALSGDEVFQAHALRPRIVAIMQALLGPDLTLYLDQLFMKAPRVGSRNVFHQDQPAGFCIDPPEPLVTCWTALDESTEENGCLRYLPRSHKLGPLSREAQAEYEARSAAGPLPGEVSLVLPPGGCGIHHGWLLHASDGNRSDRRRRGYAMHYVSSKVRYIGPEPKPQFLRVSGVSYPGCI